MKLKTKLWVLGGIVVAALAIEPLYWSYRLRPFLQKGSVRVAPQSYPMGNLDETKQIDIGYARFNVPQLSRKHPTTLTHALADE